MRRATSIEPQRLLKTLCPVVLAFIPISMLVSPVVDFLTIENRQTNWTVTMSAFAFIVTAMPLFAVALTCLKSRREKLFVLCMIGFFAYAFLFTIYAASDLYYPLFGLISVLGSTLAGVAFYVAVRDNIISTKAVIHVLAFASVFVTLPLLLVQFDTERFAQLARGISAASVLYGYENPRAVGWVSTICLALMAAYLSTQPVGNRIPPVFLLLVTVCAMMLFWSGSRGGIFAFTISFLVVFFLSQTKNRKAFLSVLSCITAGGALSYFLYLPSGSYGVFNRISRNLEQESMDAVSSGRIELWSTTVSYILERPFTGYGFLPSKSLEGFGHGSAHNIILDSWLWFGLIIGTIVILFGMMLWATAFAFFRKANDPYVSALFCVITTLIVYSMISGPYARTFPLLLFAIVSGVLLGLRSLKANDRLSSDPAPM